MGNVRDTSWTKVGEVNGDTLRNSSWTKVGELDGDVVRDASWPKVGEVDGNVVRDALTMDNFFEGYYRPFREWLQRAPSRRRVLVGDRTFIEAPIEQLDLAVGLDEELLEFPATERTSAAVSKESKDVFVGANGILVRTGPPWNSNKPANPIAPADTWRRFKL